MAPGHAWRSDPSAVSPVIGVILLVAITVVTAAVVFVLSSQFSEKTEGAPNISFDPDEDSGTVTVIRADVDVDWFRDLEVGGTCSPDLSGMSGMPTAEGRLVRAGDVLSGCQPGETLRIVASQPNILLLLVEFK